MTTGICRHCLAPVPLGADGKVARHKEQIVSASGWADGYDGCRGSGWTPKPTPNEGEQR
ncbi:hypothetical protein Rhe02_54380 [Rhizocola hellebori]|uniref:Uncharacterized protein n=1 Tax=Rhizocola hellebori TaxID=1392758 RepID=A0A8J3QDJ1_9ACTN|nr:hypothetical protein [Rhizocola hellebori]GIH07371.1 hypothetical protein Rhe02_54380 [Rhizocola hellebori]